MSTELELSMPQQRFLPTAVEAERVYALAKRIAGTEFVPKDLRNRPEAILAAMLTGREIGIGPMHALRGIDVIDGKPSLSAELMASLVFRAGHVMWVIESTNELCTMGGRRSDWPDHIPDMDLTWSLEDAKRAGLTNKGNWQKYPRAMLRARATSELCRAIFADVVERVGYVASELDEDVPHTPHAEAMETVREVAPDEADVVDAVYADDDEDSGEGEPAQPAPPPAAEAPVPSPSPDTWDVDPPANDGEWSWKEDAKARGIKLTTVLVTLQKRWGDLDVDDLNPPRHSKDVDALAKALPEVVAGVIAELDGGDS